MNTSRFFNTNDEFPLLDFVAKFSSKTDTSISFLLGRWGDTLELADSPARKLGSPIVFNVFGWIDVHHPCHGHIKTRVRAVLSDDLMVFESQREIVQAIFDALAIPRDETYEADFLTAVNQQAIHHNVDRNGMSDGI